LEDQNKNKKSNKNKQIELFHFGETFDLNENQKNNIKHSKSSLLIWRDKIHKHQLYIRNNLRNLSLQKSLISKSEEQFYIINPFLLSSVPINFWRTNKVIHKGPAMYFVVDKLNNSEIILYIGETNSADNRWKGDHDCKIYINNYKETLSENNFKSHLDIRFYLDVPKEVKLRRKLEQQLIYLWLPPFNKETRNRWATTFTTK
tara:strand:- start:1368 stop:1976 length:609 start_codon:yes stop_codon:yes gene_type:complete